jgi:riboflavin kinase/FMN adenylyltransferase
MVIIAFGMILAGVMTVHRLPAHVSLGDALHVAGGLGRLNAVDLRFDLNNRYNLWSGLIGGFFLMLSYFGTDQSQVQRYLAGSSLTQGRLGLLLNGMVKVPLQFLILLLGVLVFAFYQFHAPPLFFNPGPVKQVLAGPDAPAYRALEADYARTREVQRQRAAAFVAARHAGDAGTTADAKRRLQQAQADSEAVRRKGLALIEKANPGAHPSDVNYIFLAYVLSSLPAGLVGLVLAAVFSGSMSSMSGEISALGATTVVDFWRRLIGGSRGAREVWVGADFRFGHGRQGDVALLECMGADAGFVAHTMPAVRVDGARVSASAVRALLAAGEFAGAMPLLGRPFAIEGRIERGNQLGRTLGFPTANISLRGRISPILGIFAVRAGLGESACSWPGVASLGVRPTVNRVARPLLEVHLFDFDGDLYGQRMTVEFIAKLRDERKFDDLDALKTQMRRDARQARERLGMNPRLAEA